MAIPPSVGAFDAPTTQLEINNEWLTYLFELVGRAARLSFWSGTDEQKADAVYEIEAIITAMMTGNIKQQVGEIVMHALETLPDNWLWCDGSVHSRVDYPELYAVLHPALINNADEFSTPLMHGRMPVGAHSNQAGTVLGGFGFNDSGGEQNVTLTTSQIPTHQHSTAPANHTVLLASTAATGLRHGTLDPSGIYLQPNGGALSGIAGGGGSHNNMPPFRLVNFAIVAK